MNQVNQVPFLDLCDTNRILMPRLKDAACRVIESGRYLSGPETMRFEERLRSLCSASHCIAVSNGLDAIRLILRGYIENGRLREGDEVIVPSNTYIASVLPVTQLGLKAVLAPVDESQLNLDWHKVPSFLTPRTKAVMTVHLYGNPSWDLQTAMMLRTKGILIIEDNAQAIGAMASETGFNGTRMTGGLADAAAFSFYPTKNIGALGDAGAVVTSDPELARTVRALANYGSSTRYHNDYIGYNNRMDEIQAAFLNVKLDWFEQTASQRQAAAETYTELLQENPALKVPEIPSDGRRHVWHQYVIRTNKRDALRQWLEDRLIGTDIHYPLPIHRQACYAHGPSKADLSILPADAQQAETLASEVLSLPIANVTEQDAREVTAAINSFPF